MYISLAVVSRSNRKQHWLLGFLHHGPGANAVIESHTPRGLEVVVKKDLWTKELQWRWKSKAKTFNCWMDAKTAPPLHRSGSWTCGFPNGWYWPIQSSGMSIGRAGGVCGPGGPWAVINKGQAEPSQKASSAGLAHLNCQLVSALARLESAPYSS